MVVHHQYPCELTVWIENMEGEVVYRLASRQPTRPQRLLPLGSTLCWNGKTPDGAYAPEGSYRVRVQAYIGEASYEILSQPFLLLSPQG